MSDPDSADDPVDSWLQRDGLALLTDFYQLTMMAGYLKEGREAERARFDYFYRKPPPHAAFVVTAGLESLLRYLERLRFTDSDIAYLRGLKRFEEPFLAYLKQFRLSCTVCAMVEGTLAFPYEPIVTVEGPLIQAQLLESALLNFLNYESLVATKAARVCLAAQGDPVMEFGLRRAQGPDGGLSGSRAAYLGGCASTSHVLAGKAYGIPLSGTHAHSWVMSYPSELEAFRAFVRLYPQRSTLLVDTYDTLGSGVPNAIQAFRELRDQGHDVQPSIRLDSGDLGAQSRAAWEMFQAAGFEHPTIVASNDLDEFAIAALKAAGARINAWGVGTQLITAHNAPALTGVYKLAAIETPAGWSPRMKLTAATEKATDPGRKQVVRFYQQDGSPAYDVIQEESETSVDGEFYHRSSLEPALPGDKDGRTVALLETAFAGGRRTRPPRSLAEIRSYVFDQVHSLPEAMRRIEDPEQYPVYLSQELAQTKRQLLRGTEEAIQHDPQP